MCSYVPKPQDPAKYKLAAYDFRKAFDKWLRSRRTFEQFNKIVFAIDRIVDADNDTRDETSAAHEFDTHMVYLYNLGFKEVAEFQLKEFRRPVDDEGNDLY